MAGEGDVNWWTNDFHGFERDRRGGLEVLRMSSGHSLAKSLGGFVSAARRNIQIVPI